MNIPKIGYGTYKMPNDDSSCNAIKMAIKIGYRLIDTASRYGNEKEVGNAIKESSISRNELFITSKLWNDDQGYEQTLNAFKRTLSNLGLEYLDLYLIHWPVIAGKEEKWKQLNIDSWKAMEELYKQGLIKNIGVSNFKIQHLQNILDNCSIKPMVNQIEYHPGINEDELISFCKKNSIIVEAYSPLVRGACEQSEVIRTIATKHNKSPSQICLRWCIDKGIIPLPKSTHKERMEENFNVFNFKLKDEEIQSINEDKTFSKIFPDSDKGK